MKKILAIILAAVLVLSFAACKSDKDNGDSTAPSESSADANNTVSDESTPAEASSEDASAESTEIETVTAASGKVIVEGVNVATCHVKPRKQGEEGGIIRREIPMYASKVMRVCPKCGKATREAFKVENGAKVRVCKKCGETI